MDGFDPLDPNTYLSNPLPIHTAVTNEEYNNFLPTLDMATSTNNYNIGYGR